MSRWWPGTARGSGAVGWGVWEVVEGGVGGVGGPRSASNEKQRPKSLKWRAVTAQRSLPLQCDVMRTSCRHPAGGGGGGGPSAHPESPLQPPPPAWHSRERGGGERERLPNRKWRVALRTARSYLWRRMCGGDDKPSTSSGGTKPPHDIKGLAVRPPWPRPRPHPRALVPPPDHLAAASYPTCRCCRSWDGVQKSSAHTCLHPGRERGGARGAGGVTRLLLLHNSLFWDAAGWHLTHKADKAQLVTSMRPVVATMALLAAAAAAATTERWTTPWRCNPGSGGGGGGGGGGSGGRRQPLQSSQEEERKTKRGKRCTRPPNVRLGLANVTEMWSCGVPLAAAQCMLGNRPASTR